MTRKQAYLALAVASGVLLVALVVLAVLLPSAGELEPTATPRGPIFGPRDVPTGAAPTRYPAVIDSTYGNVPQVPPLRPTHDPLYTPGSRYPFGTECLYSADLTWGTKPDGGPACTTEPCSTSNYDWSRYTACIDGAAAYTVTLSNGEVAPGPVALTIPPREREGNGAGTYASPYMNELAPDWWYTGTGNAGWLQRFTYNGHYYWGVNYDDPSLVNRMKQLISEAHDLYAYKPNIVAVRVNVGFVTEAQPIKCNNADAGCIDKDLKLEHESQVASCAAYRAYVRTLANYAYDLFNPHGIGVYVAAGPALCGNATYSTGQKSRKWLWEDLTEGWALGANPRAIGYGGNAISPDMEDADEQDGNLWASWRFYQYGYTAQTYPTPAPVAWEYRYNPSSIGGDVYQWDVWSAYVGAGTHGRVLYPFTTWNGLHQDLYWEVVDRWLGDYPDRAWVVLRDAEYPQYNWQTGYGVSGLRGDMQHNLSVVGPESYPQACSTPVQQAAKAVIDRITLTPGYPTPEYRPCGVGQIGGTPVALPTPKATIQATPSPDPTSQFNVMQRVFNRQARLLTQYTTMPFALEETAPWYGSQRPITVTVSYLDIGTGNFTVQYASAPTVTSAQQVVLTDTGLWQRAVLPIETAYLTNQAGFPAGSAFMMLLHPNAQDLYLHEVYIDVGPEPTQASTMLIHASAYHDLNRNLNQDSSAEPNVPMVEFFLLSNDVPPTTYDSCVTDGTGFCDLEATVAGQQRIEVASWPAGYQLLNPSYQISVTLGTTTYFPVPLWDVNTPTPTPTPTATPGPGYAVVYGYGDTNGNHLEDAGESHLAPITWWVSTMDDPETALATCTTVDANVDCRFTLAAGQYYINISQTDPLPPGFSSDYSRIVFQLAGGGAESTIAIPWEEVPPTLTPTATATAVVGLLHIYPVDSTPNHNLLTGGSWRIQQYQASGLYTDYATCADPCYISLAGVPNGQYRALALTAPAGYTPAYAFMVFAIDGGNLSIPYEYAPNTPTPTATATATPTTTPQPTAPGDTATPAPTATPLPPTSTPRWPTRTPVVAYLTYLPMRVALR